MEINFIFSSSKIGGIASKKVVIPFNHNIEIDGITNECKLNTDIEIAMQDFVIMPDESIDIKIDLIFLLDIFKNANLNLISNVSIQENKEEAPQSIIIYYTKPGDTLWKIAKKFKSTVTNIRSMNGIEDEEKINVGEQLFIPKYVPKVGIENI